MPSKLLLFQFYRFSTGTKVPGIPPGTPESIGPLLEMADQALAKQQMPVSERPLAAVIQLVRWELIAGTDGLPIALDGTEIAKSETFRPLGKMIGD